MVLDEDLLFKETSKFVKLKITAFGPNDIRNANRTESYEVKVERTSNLRQLIKMF
jgi:hypothetical protein